MAKQQTKPPSTSEASRQADDSSSGTQDEGDPTRPSSSGGQDSLGLTFTVSLILKFLSTLHF